MNEFDFSAACLLATCALLLWAQLSAIDYTLHGAQHERETAFLMQFGDRRRMHRL